MDSIKFQHLKHMKQFLIVSLLLLSHTFYAQDTLYHAVHGLGDEQFVLKEKGSFVFTSSLCGTEFIALGTYKKTFRGYRFDYDSTLCPKPSVHSLMNGRHTDSLKVVFYSMIDSTLCSYSDTLFIGGQSYICNASSLTLDRRSFVSDTLRIKEPAQFCTTHFDKSAEEIHIYISPNGFGFICGESDISKLRKKKWGYLHKFYVYDENKDKPWKKGKKREVRHYYELKSN